MEWEEIASTRLASPVTIYPSLYVGAQAYTHVCTHTDTRNEKTP